MKIVHANWEQRNMGVDTWEIEVEKTDSYQKLDDVIDNLKAEYIVVKIPASRQDLGFQIQRKGFCYVETIIAWHRSAEKPVLSSIQQRIIDQMTYCEMNGEEELELWSNIRMKMFTTDRVIVDPYFNEKQASERYIGWIKDEKKIGAKIFVIKWKGKNVGFFLMRLKENGTAYPAIAGMYPNSKLVGIGLAMDYFEIIEAERLGAKRIVASVSTNNVSALNILAHLGYSIDKNMVVYVKHVED